MNDRKPGASRIGSATILASGLIFTSLIAMSQPSLGADDGHRVPWQHDLAQAQVEARLHDRLLWIQFTGPWCVNCRRMDRSTFADPRVVTEAAERFVPVKLRSDEFESLTANLGLTMLPATVIIRPNGEVVDKMEGYVEPDQFASFLNAVLTAEGRTAAQVATRAKAKAEKDSSVALAGYDPVSLLQNQQLVPGRADLSVEHDGRTFRFADEAGRAAFLRRPESFAPVNGGRCPVSQVDRGDFATGDPRWGVVYGGHLFLFRDVTERDRFAKDPERYAGLDPSTRASCPHCRERAPLPRRLSSRFSSMFIPHMTPSPPPSVASVGSSNASASPSTVTDRLASLLTLDSIRRR